MQETRLLPSMKSTSGVLLLFLAACLISPGNGLRIFTMECFLAGVPDKLRCHEHPRDFEQSALGLPRSQYVYVTVLL